MKLFHNIPDWAVETIVIFVEIAALLFFIELRHRQTEANIKREIRKTFIEMRHGKNEHEQTGKR